MNRAPPPAFQPVRALGLIYVLSTIGTLAFLLWQRHDPRVATTEAWVHAGVVCLFALLLLRVIHAASTSHAGATRRLQIISIVLVAISLLEACIPHLFPTWMRVEQALYAALLTVMALLVRSARQRDTASGASRA